MNTRTQPLTFYALVAALIFGAYLLRVYRLDSVPLRGDEAFNAMHWTQTPFTATWFKLIETEPNPGSLIVYWLWSRLAGKTEFALRYLPVLANLLGGAITAALAWKLTRRRPAAAILLALWMVAPFLIWHAQDARQYALLTALTPLNLYLLLKALERHPRRGWILYIVFQTLTLYIYYVEVFWMAAQALLVWILRRDRFKRLLLAWGIIGVLIVPLLAQIYLVTFVSGYAATAHSADWPDLLTVFVPTLLFGDSRWAFLPALMLIAALLVAAWRSRARVILLAWPWIPLLALTVISLKANFFLPRYVTAVTPALLLTVALGVDSVPRRSWRVGLIAVYGMFALLQLRGYYGFDPPKAPDWPGLMGYLAERSTPQTGILFLGADPAIEYYHHDASTLYLLPDDWYGGDWQAVLDRLLREKDALFLLAGANTGDTAAYLQANAQSIPGDSYPGVSQFRAWDVDEREIQHPQNVVYGDVAILRGYTQVGDTTLLLYWEPLTQTDRDYSVLLHLESAPDVPVVVLDHAPAGAIISTRAWIPGVVYRDPVALPPDLRGGETILVGMYPADTPSADGRVAVGRLRE